MNQQNKKQSKEKIAKLVKQYPFLGEILEGKMNDLEGITPEITIKFKRADENLLMFRGEYIDGIRSSIARENQVMGTKFQFLHLVGYNNEISEPFFWFGKTKERIKDVILTTTTAQRVKYIVLVTKYDLFEEIEDYYDRGLEGPMGNQVGRELTLYVYLPPREGLAELLERTDPMKNVRLHIDDIIWTQLLRESTYDNVVAEARRLAKLFESKVYFNGLKKIIDSSTMKGMRGKFGSTELLTFTMCGRIMFTFKRGENNVSFLCAEGEIPSRIGLHSIDATWPVAKSMIEEVIEVWEKTDIPMDEKIKNDSNMIIC